MKKKLKIRFCWRQNTYSIICLKVNNPHIRVKRPNRPFSGIVTIPLKAN